MELRLGETIRTLRKGRGITQETLADHVGVGFQAVSKWETGTACPDISLLPKIARYFGITTDELLGLGKAGNKTEDTPPAYNGRLTGGCNCGALAYEVDSGGIIRRSDCGCRECQKNIGALTVPFISVEPAKFKFITGTGVHYKAADGKDCDKWGHWVFCPLCGTTVVWINDSGTEHALLPGTINETDVIGRIPR